MTNNVKIAQSTTEPGINNLWLNNGILKQFNGTEWKSISGEETTSEGTGIHQEYLTVKIGNIVKDSIISNFGLKQIYKDLELSFSDLVYEYLNIPTLEKQAEEDISAAMKEAGLTKEAAQALWDSLGITKKDIINTIVYNTVNDILGDSSTISLSASLPAELLFNIIQKYPVFNFLLHAEYSAAALGAEDAGDFSMPESIVETNTLYVLQFGYKSGKWVQYNAISFQGSNNLDGDPEMHTQYVSYNFITKKYELSSSKFCYIPMQYYESADQENSLQHKLNKLNSNIQTLASAAGQRLIA